MPLSRSGSVVARNLLAPLVRLLRLDGHRGDRAGDQPIDPDRLAGDFAPAVLALVDPAQGGIDFGDKFALAVARAQFDAPIGFAGRAVVEVGLANRPFLQGLQGELGSGEDRLLPFEQQHAEVIELLRRHVLFVVAGCVIGVESPLRLGQNVDLVTKDRGHLRFTPTSIQPREAAPSSSAAASSLAGPCRLARL